MAGPDPLGVYAQALLGEVLARPDLAAATGTYDLDVAGRRVRVTVTADEGGPFVAGRVVRVLVEEGGRVGYAAGFHAAAFRAEEAHGSEPEAPRMPPPDAVAA